MKLESAPQDVTFHGDFEQRDVAIGDVAFILDMFADKVYSNKERAVIRELACNAHDSHVMAGTTDVPFDVHLPTQLEPWFSLRDYGTGLADDDIANVYGVNSHKREPYYASSECKGSEFFEHLAKTTESDIILYTPCTSPFISLQTYYNIINQ